MERQIFLLAPVVPAANGQLNQMAVIQLAQPVVLLVALGLLYPRALPAIAYSAGDQGSPKRRMRIMDYGAEVQEE